MALYSLFIELLRISLGVQTSISHNPTRDEWWGLYHIAVQQSLVGICFVGVQHLAYVMNRTNAESGQMEIFTRLGMDEVLFLTWLGMVVQIQQRNGVVNRQCAELQKIVSEAGFHACILKGQGLALEYQDYDSCNVQSKKSYFSIDASLRQSGDIDVLLWTNDMRHKKNRNEVIRFAKSFDKYASGSEHHVHVQLFEGTEVELHYQPSYFCNPLINNRFRRWSMVHRKDMLYRTELNCWTPNSQFNLLFLLSHMFRHYLSEGISLKQLVDYYYVLRGIDPNIDYDQLMEDVKSMNMQDFASAVMWVMKTVFDLDDSFTYCRTDELRGKKLLEHTLKNVIFRPSDIESSTNLRIHWKRFLAQLSLDLSLARYYPSEALWAPISMLREFFRVRI